MQNTKRLFIAAIAVAVILLAVWASAPRATSGSRAGEGGSSAADPCSAPALPQLEAGLKCVSARNGKFAWLAASAPIKAGVAVNATPVQSWTATEQNCVAENVCQKYCDDAPACTFYKFDASRQASKEWCPTAGAVCSVYTAALPANFGSGQTPYVSVGIHSRALGPR